MNITTGQPPALVLLVLVSRVSWLTGLNGAAQIQGEKQDYSLGGNKEEGLSNFRDRFFTVYILGGVAGEGNDSILEAAFQGVSMSRVHLGSGLDDCSLALSDLICLIMVY